MRGKIVERIEYFVRRLCSAHMIVNLVKSGVGGLRTPKVWTTIGSLRVKRAQRRACRFLGRAPVVDLAALRSSADWIVANEPPP
jgi:hypothetical protein